MITKELELYVKDLLTQGYDKELIRTQLIKSGEWTRDDTDEVFMLAEKTEVNSSQAEPAMSPEVVQTSQSDIINTNLTDRSDFNEKVTETKSQIVKSEIEPNEEENKKVEFDRVQQNENEPHGVRHAFFVLGVLIAVVLVFSGVAYGYVKYFSYDKGTTPYEVLIAMWEVNDVKTVRTHINTDLSGTLEITPLVDNTNLPNDYNSTSSLPEIVNIDFGMELGKVKDETDSNNSLSEGSFSVDLLGSYSFMNVDFSANIDFKMADKIYIRMRDITPLPYLGDLSTITNKWIEFGYDEFSRMALYKQDEQVNKLLKEVDTVAVEKWVNSVVKNNQGRYDVLGIPVYYYTIQLDEKDWEMIIDGFVSGLQGFVDELDSNDEVYFFEQDISRQNMKKIIEGIITNYNSGKETQEYSNLLRVLSLSKLEMWIGKEDFYLYKADLSFAINEFAYENVVFNMMFNATKQNSEFNKPVEINIPDEFITFNQARLLFEEILAAVQ